jgi:hypothetical protein
MTTLRSLFLHFLPILLALAGSGCNPVKSNAAAESAVADFHQKLDAGDFKTIYDTADQGFKKAAPEKDFVALLEAIHRKLGNVQSTNRQGWNINSYNFQTYVELTYQTKFAEGDGTEKFRYRIEKGRALLLYYNINSTALITK